MPWTTKDPPRPAKNWSGPAKALCVRVANAVLKDTNDDQKAIFACIHAVKVRYPSEIKSKSNEELEDFSWFDGLTREQLEALEKNNPDLIEIAFEPIASKSRSGLPDSAFAIVYSKPDGTKIRALPHHTASGGLDLSHLRNALARWNQVKGVPSNVKRAGLQHLEAHARKAGVGEKKAASEHITSLYSLEGITFEQSGEGDSARYITKGLTFAVGGRFVHPFWGEIDLEDNVLRDLKRNFDRGVLKTDVAIDERHDRGRALGWVKSLNHPKKVNLNGKDYNALLGDVEWTPEGRKLLEDKSYKYFSPEFGTYVESDGKTEHKNVLLGGALTNRPFLKMMPSVKFAEHEAKGTAKNVLMFDDGDPSEGDEDWQFDDNPEVNEAFDKAYHKIDLEEEDDDNTMKFEEFLAKLKKDLGVEFADEAALISALQTGSASQQQLETIRSKAKEAGITFDEKTSTADIVTGMLVAQQSTITTLQTQVGEISKKLSEDRRNTAVAELIRSRKITPAQKAEYQKLYDTDVKLFESLTGTLTVNESLPHFGPAIGGPGEVPEPGEELMLDDEKAQEKARGYLESIGLRPKSAVGAAKE